MQKTSYKLSTLIQLLFFSLISLQVSAQVTRQPYLQIPSPHSMIIRWQTGTGVPGKVYYGTSSSELNLSVTESAEDRIYHEVAIGGLKPSTKYYYSVEDSLKGTETQYFITPPEIGRSTPVRIWVISDFGQSTSDQNERRVQTVESWKSFNNNDYHASFVLSLGDQTEDDAIYQIQHNYFSQLEKVLSVSPLYTTVGNHDNHDSTFNYQNTFTLPQKGEAGGVPSGSEKYYSFVYSNIHVVVLCSEIYDTDQRTAQTDWLKKDLENNKQGWLIACMHQPLHSAGYHPTDDDQSSLQRKKEWLTILEDHGVDLILQGHNHVYERSYLVDNIIGNSTSITDANKINTGLGRAGSGGPYIKPVGCIPHKGTIFLTCTGGGVANSTKYYPVPYSFIPVSFPGSDFEGSVVLDIKGNRLDANFLCNEINDKGSHIWDSFTILKESRKPLLSKPF
jgi:predicted phosphodiesterase